MEIDFDGIRLTDLQKNLLKWVVKAHQEGKEYFYCEVGDCKPWDNRTVSALEHRRIVKLMKGGDNYIKTDGVYFLALGEVVAKQIRENKLKKLLKKHEGK